MPPFNFNFQIPTPKRSFFDELTQQDPPDLPKLPTLPLASLWQAPDLEPEKPPQLPPLDPGQWSAVEAINEPEGRVSVTPPVRDVRDIPGAVKGWQMTAIPRQKLRIPQSAQPAIGNQTSTPPEATVGQEPASVFTQAPLDAARAAIRSQGGLTGKISGYEAIANRIKMEKGIAAGGDVVQSKNLETQKVPVRFSVNIPQGTNATAREVKRAVLQGAGMRPDVVDQIERAIGAPLLNWTPEEQRSIETTVNFYRKPVTKTMAEAEAYKGQLYRYASETNVPRSAFAVYDAFLRGGPDAAREAYGMLERNVKYAPQSRAVTDAERAEAVETYRPSKYGAVEALSQFGQSALKQGLAIPEGAAGMIDTVFGGDDLTQAVRPFTEATQGFVERMMPVDEKNQSWMTAKIPQAFGSTVPLIAGGAVMRAPKLGAALLGAATNVQQVGQEFDAARAAQPFPDKFEGNRRLATTLAGLTGTLEAFGIESRIAQFGTRSRLLEAVEGGVIGEGAPEALTELLNDLNAVYGGKYDKKRSIGKTMMESFALGAVVGTGFEGTSFLASKLADRRERLAYAAGVAQAQPDSPLGKIVQQAGITLETISKADDRAVDELTKRLEVWARAESKLKQLQYQREQLAAQTQGAEAKLQAGRVPTGPELQIADQVAEIEEQIVQTQLVQDETVAEMEEKASPLFRRLRDAQSGQQAPSTGAQAPSVGPQAASTPTDEATGIQGVGSGELGVGSGQSPLFRRIAEAVAASQPQVETLTDVEEQRPDMLAEIRREGGMTGDVEAGELRRIGLKEGGTTGLVQRTGLSPDEMRERMVSEGLSQAETATDFIQEVEEELRRQKQRGGQEDVSYEDFARAQMSEGEREQSDRLDALMRQPENPFTQAFRRLDNPKVPLTRELLGEFVEEAEREGFDDDFIDNWVSEARARRGIAGPRVEPGRITSTQPQPQSLSQLERELETVDRRIADKRRQGEETADDWAERRRIERQVEEITGKPFREYPRQPVPQEPAPAVRANVIPEWMRNRNVYRMGGKEITDFVGQLREEKARQDAAGRESVDRGLWNTTRILLQSAEQRRGELKKDKTEIVPALNQPGKVPTKAERGASQKRATAAREAAEASVPDAGGPYLSSEQMAAELAAERQLKETPDEERQVEGEGKPDFKKGDRVTFDPYIRGKVRKDHPGTVEKVRQVGGSWVVDINPDPVKGISAGKQFGVPLSSVRAEEKPKYDFSSTQVDLPKDVADKIRAFGRRIPDKDLAEDGREDTPHITVKYGLHGADPQPTREALAGEGPITVKLGKVTLFETDDADVVKVDVESPDLHRLNKKIAESQPTTDTFPDYKPHITIAYVQKGKGKRYVGKGRLEGKTITLDTVTFSGRDGEIVQIPLSGAPAVKGRTGDIEADLSTAFDEEIGKMQASAPGQEAKPAAEADFSDLFDDALAEMKAEAAPAQPAPAPSQQFTSKSHYAHGWHFTATSEDGENVTVSASTPATTKTASIKLSEYRPHRGKNFVGGVVLRDLRMPGKAGSLLVKEPAFRVAIVDALSEVLDQVDTAARKPERQPRTPAQRKPAQRTAGEAASSAVKKSKKGLDAAAKGIMDLFEPKPLNPNERRMALLPFDEDTYRKAKVHFQEAWDHFADAAADAREAMRLFLRALKDEYGMSIEGIERMKPYIVRFVADAHGSAKATPAAEVKEARKGDIIEYQGRRWSVTPQTTGVMLTSVDENGEIVGGPGNFHDFDTYEDFEKATGYKPIKPRPAEIRREEPFEINRAFINVLAMGHADLLEPELVNRIIEKFERLQEKFLYATTEEEYSAFRGHFSRISGTMTRLTNQLHAIKQGHKRADQEEAKDSRYRLEALLNSPDGEHEDAPRHRPERAKELRQKAVQKRTEKEAQANPLFADQIRGIEPTASEKAETSTTILHRIKGEEGMEAHVAKIASGYSVTMYDADADEYFPTSKIFKTEDAALDYANTIAATDRVNLTQGVESGPEVKADVLGEPDKGEDQRVGEPAERQPETEGGERAGELRPTGRARSGSAPSRGDRAERRDGEDRTDDAGTEAAAQPTDPGSHEEFAQDETRAEDQPPSATKRAPDYVITDDEAHTPAGTETKLKANFTALRLLRTLEAEGRTPTVEEQRQLAEYTGWGQFPDVFDRYSRNGMKRAPEREELISLIGQAEYDEAAASTLNAHYTHPAIARAIWGAIQKMGFKGGRVIEPGVGIGNFIGVTPESLRRRVKWTGVDKNPTSSAIAKALYPSTNIQVLPYESLATPDGFFDLAIGNVPFGDYKPYDPRYKNFRANIHDYFFLKTLDQVRPGGVLALITSTGTMDKLDTRIRQAMAEKADLVAAIRLPGKTFSKNAGTDVVTDIIFLRRRADGEKPSDVKWTETAEVDDPEDGAPIAVNEYFRDNPDQIIGRLDRKGTMYRRDTMNVTRLDDFEEKFAAAIERLPENIFTERGKPSPETWAEPQYAEAGQREGSTVIKDGKIFTVEKLKLQPRELSAKDRERVIGMMKLRDLGQAVLDAQRERLEETAVSSKRAALKREYERFTKANGFLHQRTNAALLAEDIDGPIILALENWDAKTKKGTVADLAITPPPRNVKPENAGDAVAQSLRDHGKLDLDEMAEALGVKPEELGRRLVSEGLAFNDPSKGWVDRAEYLSGNVRRKLLEAKAAAEADPSFEPNVKVLEEVQPDDIPTDEIHVKLGAPWVPPSDVTTFVQELLGLNRADGLDLAYLTQDGSWRFGFTKNNAGYGAASSEAARKIFATERANFADILNAGLNDVPIRIMDVSKGSRGETISTFNADASSEANGRVYELKERFKEWIWEDEARSKRLHRFYNDNFNNLRTRIFDALHYRGADGKYRLPGMSPNYDLRPQQANAVYRAVQDGVALFGHEVGVGKSATMIAAAMEHRRLGLAKKPLIATTKSVLPGLANEARRFYPGAKVLVVEGGLDAAKRKRMMAQIATGDWDMVITTHDNLEALPVRPEWAAGFIKKQLEEVTAAYLEAKEEDKGSRIVKELEKLKQKLEGKYAEIINEKKRDDAVYFEDLGVDMLEIDEFHKYKSLPVYTAQRGVKGIPTGQSDRAVDMLMKMRWVYEMNGGRNIYGATGTPVTNTIAEVFNLQRYFQPQELEARGIQAFDAWAKTFGDFSHRMEQTSTGEYQAVTRFNRFANLQELMQMSRQIGDIVFASDVGAIKRPKRKEEVFAAEASPEQLAFLAGLQERMQAIRTGKVKPWEDNALAVASDARKMSLDFRLVDAGHVSPVETKVDKLIKNVLQIHKDHPGKTQMIFSDLGINVTEKTPFSVYQDIVKRLVAGGIPREKIIDFSTITDTQRKTAAERLFDADALIGIGGSEKMGTGVNAQQHLIALHHLDVPWLPAHLEQRDGRGWRQGNLNPELMINRYVTENSFDTFMWQLIDSKSRFIRAFMKGDENARTASEEEGDTFTEAQIMAIASGDPDLLARVQLEDDITNLERSERQHNRQQSRLRDTQERLKTDIPRLERRATRMEEDVKYLEELPEDVPRYVVGGKTFEKRDLTAIALRDAALAASWTQPTIIGTYKDFDIVINRAGRSAYLSRDSVEQGSPRYEFSPNLDEPLTMMASIEGQARNIGNKAKWARSEYETAKTDVEKIGKEVGKPFGKADQLQAKKAELAELNAKMKAKSKPDEEKAEEGNAEEGGVMASLEADRGAIAATDVASPADHFYHSQMIVKDRGKRGAVVYMNDHAKMILAAALDEVTGHKYYHANAVEVTRENLQKATRALEAEVSSSRRHGAEILRVVEEWERVLEDHPNQKSFTFHDVTQFAHRREAAIPSDREAAVRKFKATSREERFHWSQRQVVGGQGWAQVGASWAQSTKGWGKYRRALMSFGYPDNPEILAAEIAAHIAAGKYADLAVRTEAEIAAAEEWLARYFERVAERYGIGALDKFGSLLEHAGRARKRAVTDVYTRQTAQSGAQTGQAGATGNRPPPAGGGGRRVQGGAPGGQGRQGGGPSDVRQTSAFSPPLPPEAIDWPIDAGPMPEWQRGLGEMKSPVSSPDESIDAGPMPDQQRGLGRMKSPASSPDEPIDAGAMPERQPGLGSIKSPQFSPNDPINAGEMPEDQQQLIETEQKRNAGDFVRTVGDLWHLPKALRASGDLSASARQGLFLSLPPTQWHRALRAFKRQVLSLKKSHYDQFVKELRAHKAYRDAKAAGLYIASDDPRGGPLSEREESFASEMAEKLPWVRWSEQAYKTYLDSLRLDTFAKYKKQIDKQFRDPGERFEAYQAAAEWLNTSTGRGKFHGRFGQLFDKSLPFLNVFLFAPRYVASRIQMLNPLTYARNLKNPRSRVVFRQQMSELFQSAAMLGTIGALAHAAGASISFDDDDPDFLKLRFGSTRYDVLGGLQQVLRLAFKISRWAEAEMTEDDEKALRAKRGDTRDYALKYLRGKLSPTMGFITNWLNDWVEVTGERHAPGDFITSYQEGTYAKMAEDIASNPIISQALPLLATDLVAAWYAGYKNTGDAGEGFERMIKALPAGIGVGVQDYERPEYTAPVKKYLSDMGIEPRYPKKDKYETEKEYEARIPLVIQDQAVIVQEFQNDDTLKEFPKEIQREVLNDAISENGRERMQKLKPEWLHKDWQTQAAIEEWKRDMEQNPVFQQMSGAAKKAAMESFTQRMGKFRAHAGKKPTPPRPFTGETVRKIIAKSLSQ